jgi:hypothetical protein
MVDKLELTKKLTESSSQLCHERNIICRIGRDTSSIVGPRVLPVQINAVETVMIHEGKQTRDELLTVSRRARHITEGASCWARVRKTPASDRYPCLWSVGFRFRCGESAGQFPARSVHRGNLKSRRIEKGKGEVDMCQAVEIQVFGRDRIACASIGPGFVVTNCAFQARASRARGSNYVATATKTCLASRATEIGS